ncbi:XRE family transcriptional regulator [Streptomyces ipomoeae]|uniref:Toxin-antitoxin system, antitoxin component, Xre family n=2 Tax=Streptomyces ipomoeae TaxID=103232 RepID=L1KTG9_9ACTN|nr:helix-turn-helix transcriptional regulator [Streptomyces ipomoeae]EKX63927.1 toxin-antitoxin system, antitoxin component, Xre family [Streptomyces ipomoeae 91-03]MDX2694827.1 helix-turn-helix transcriptional regulator [Streptomyces ipomoeae]MDX2824582.1 helix-turn-helix transcriptional regulator [Streptomyces ipomoeae]MDX2842875.1 helix-turn-helix transcriptional regulator [Streptomyces ipomoeae]MDX2877250.1 helix-turn-helix transcriptional regulator [Streptomyces ipomoeae]
MPDKRQPPPTVRLRRLAVELRRLREGVGLTHKDVAEKTAINEVTLYRIEKARTKPQKRTLMTLLDLYEATEEQRSALLDIQRGPHDRAWLQPYHTDLGPEYATYIAFEAEARTVRNYETLFIPGLAQTESYTRAMIKGVVPTANPKWLEQRVQVRLERQMLLAKEDPLRFWGIIDEAVVRRTVGSRKVMQEQIRHLLRLMDEPHITFQVIPFDKGAHPGMDGGFAHMDFPDPDDPELVYLSNATGEIFLESEDELRRYKSKFEYLQAVALGPNDTADLLSKLAEGRD